MQNIPSGGRSVRFLVLATLTVVLLSSCQLMSLFSPTEPTGGNPGSTVTLADGIIDDFIGKIQGTTFTRALDSNNKLSSSDLEKLRRTIKAKILLDDLESSNSLDDVLPSVMEGISFGVKNWGDLEGDTAVSSQLLTQALQSASESMSKNIGKASAAGALPSILQKVIKKGAEDLAVIAKKDPESAAQALKTVVTQVSTALQYNSSSISATEVLKAVVTASVQAVVQGGESSLVQSVFEGTAKATSNGSIVSEVVISAVTKAREGQEGTILNEATATDILQQATAGLGVLATDDVLTAATQELKNLAVTVVVTTIEAVRTEDPPIASLTATIGGQNYEEGTVLDYTASGVVTFATNAAAGTTEELIGPNGNIGLTGNSATFTLSGSGSFRFILLVKNTNGVKSAFKSLIIRVASQAEEKAPTAVVVVNEGTVEVTTPLAWTKTGHTLTFGIDTTGSTQTTRVVVQSDSPNAVPTETAGVWSVVQKYGTVNYTVIVKNVAGSMSTSVAKAITVSAEPAVTAVLKAYNGSTEITGTLPRKATYDVTLRSEGTTSGTVQSLTVSPSASVVKESDGVWTATLLASVGSYTFTFTAQTDGGQNKATINKTVAIAAEAAPVALLTIKKDGTALTSALPYTDAGYDLILDPAGSTTANTELSIGDDKNQVIVKNSDGTWTAKAVQQTTVFTLTVKNLGGVLSSTTTKTVTINPPGTTDISADVATGIEAVKQHLWTAAKTAFASALLKNPSDADAKIWSAFLDLVTLSVHPQVVDLMRNRVGVADYPAKMEDLLAKEWMKATARASQPGFKAVTTFNKDGYYFIRGNIVAGGGTQSHYNYYYDPEVIGNDSYSSRSMSGVYDFVPSATGSVLVNYWNQSNGDYLRAEDYATATTVSQNLVYARNYYFLGSEDLSPIPLLSPVEGFERLDIVPAGTPATPAPYGAADYMRLLVANVFSRNPLGFNAFVDQVATGPFGASLDSILARLTSLGDAERTLIPVDLVDQITSRFGMNAASLAPVTIGKPELLLLAANLKMMKSFVQYLSSVNFDYPISQALVDGISKPDHPDANGDGQDDYTHAVYTASPGFYFSNVLRDRDTAARAASKATFLSALDNVSSSLNLYKTLVADETTGYRTALGPMIVAMAGSTLGSSMPTHDQVIAALDNFIAQVTTFRTAVANNTDLTVNASLASPGSINPFEAVLGHFPSDGAWVVRPGEVWANNVFDPRFWMEGTNTEGLTLYFKSDDWGTEGRIFKPVPSDRTMLNAGYYGLSSTETTGSVYRYQSISVALKLNKSSLQKFYPAANPSDSQLAARFGPGWNTVKYTYSWNSTTGYTYSYTYSLQPPVYVNEFLAWVNKK